MDNKSFRRLVAVMFTDIVGYTALMQSDESAAALMRNRHRRVFESCHESFEGEILQYFGDGTLSVFQSGVKAVECALAMQQKFGMGESVPLRIGIHIGDIVFDGTDIYGDGVNLASRIESMGTSGSILLSDQLNRELLNHAHISTVSLGQFQMKNVELPVEIHAVSNDGIKVPDRSEMKGKQEHRAKSIAVLPFVNMSSDEENEYFCDGITEEIINALAKINGLKVTSRTSSFYFKKKNITIRQIGNELNVSTILEGSIRLAGNRMRITAQLIDVTDDFHFWSETFDRSLEDIFAVQDEISLLIADKLREHIGHLEFQDQLVEHPDVSVDLYKKYLESRYLILKMNKQDIEKGITLLEEALILEPEYTLANLGVHFGYTMLGTIGLMPAQEAFTKGKPFLDKAIEINPNLPECQLHLAWRCFLENWDFHGTYEHLHRSFEIRPVIEYYQTMSSTLVAEGKFEAALNYIDTALQLDPFSGINYHLKGFCYYVQGEFQTAIEWFEKSVKIQSDSMVSVLYLGQALLLLKRHDEALKYFESLQGIAEEDLFRLGGMTLSYAAKQDRDNAYEGMDELKKEMEGERMERVINLLILCHTLLGEFDEALDLIQRGISLRLPLMIYLYVEPMVKPLHDDPRFRDMMGTIFKGKTVEHKKSRKYKKVLFSEEELFDYQKSLEALMDDQRPYLDPNLTLRELAARLKLPTNHLSQLLNEGFKKNFAEFVNGYRLEAFKSNVSTINERSLTILGLAFESGFNSKTVFNTFFKKSMGTTPKAFVNEVIGK